MLFTGFNHVFVNKNVSIKKLCELLIFYKDLKKLAFSFKKLFKFKVTQVFDL